MTSSKFAQSRNFIKTSEIKVKLVKKKSGLFRFPVPFLDTHLTQGK